MGPAAIQPTARSPKLAPQTEDDEGRYVPIGPFISSTWIATVPTCPPSCPYLGNGCYAEASGWMTSKLNAAAVGMSARDVLAVEADRIDSLFSRGIPQDGGRHGDRGRDLRLHVSGDFEGVEGARLVAGACDRYLSRKGGVPYTYTHRYRELVPSDLGPVHAIASAETPAQAEEAMDLGWAAAMTVRSFPNGGRQFGVLGSAIRFVPCPEQVLGAVRISCVECRLCMDPVRLRSRGIAIAFEPHGRDREKARRQLPVLRAA